jgi:hypothetical protein
MEQAKFAKQMIEFQKTTFDNTFSAMVMLQEQAERMGKMMLEQATWLPEEGQKAIDEWVDAYRKGRDEFKQAVDDSFDKVVSFFDESRTASFKEAE